MLVRAIARILAAIFPSTDGIPGLDRVDATPTIRSFLSEAPWSIRLAVYGSALAFVLTPLLTIGWPLPSLLLPRGRLDEHAYRLAGHRSYLLRQAMLMLKTVGGVAWGGHPEVRAALQLPAYDDDPGTFRTGGEGASELRFAGVQQERAGVGASGSTLR